MFLFACSGGCDWGKRATGEKKKSSSNARGSFVGVLDVVLSPLAFCFGEFVSYIAETVRVQMLRVSFLRPRTYTPISTMFFQDQIRVHLEHSVLYPSSYSSLSSTCTSLKSRSILSFRYMPGLGGSGIMRRVSRGIEEKLAVLRGDADQVRRARARQVLQAHI